MKNRKTFPSLLLVCVVSIFSIFIVAGCGNEAQTDADTGSGTETEAGATQSPSEDKPSNKIFLEAQAISIATESKRVKDEIARDLGFQSYRISLGSTSAYLLGSGWFVKLKGSIIGYIDDYNSKFASKKFEATVHVVAATGEIFSVRTQQVY